MKRTLALLFALVASACGNSTAPTTTPAYVPTSQWALSGTRQFPEGTASNRFSAFSIPCP